jgi:hypothetical protein
VPLDDHDLDVLVDRLANVIVRRLRVEHDRLLDRPALAERLGVCERTVSQMAARGDIPTGFLLGGVRRWDWGTVLRHLVVPAISHATNSGACLANHCRIC